MKAVYIHSLGVLLLFGSPESFVKETDLGKENQRTDWKPKQMECMVKNLGNLKVC